MDAITWPAILAFGIFIGLVLGAIGMAARMDRDCRVNPWPEKEESN